MTTSNDTAQTERPQTAAGMTYGQYLGLDQLLSAQHPLSDQRDELLFIIIHQTKELWLKEILSDVELAMQMIRDGQLTPAYKSLARVSRIQTVMTLSWDILATLTPSDYTRFRDVLGSSSGFQSAQFRELEYRLGLKDAHFLKYHLETPEPLARLEAALDAPSLYDEALLQLAKAGFDLPEARTGAALREAYQADPKVEAAWLEVYRQTERYWDLYQLAEKLVDLEDALITWRHKHALTVERVIGRKRGTGGTDGVGYLKSTLEKRCFPELWTIRTQL